MKTGSEIILYENANLLAIQKPPGLPSSPLPQDPPEKNTACEMVFQLRPEIRKVGQKLHLGFSRSFEKQGGLLHRLDTETTGILLFAKNDAFYSWMVRHWKSAVKKYYRARVTGHRPATGTIRWEIANSKKSSKKVIVLKPDMPLNKKQIRGKSREAITVIESLVPIQKEASPSCWDLSIHLVTGIRHQIRAHCSAAGHPILGDRLYGGKKNPHFYLHAERVRLNGPEILEILAPLPPFWNRS